MVPVSFNAADVEVFVHNFYYFIRHWVDILDGVEKRLISDHKIKQQVAAVVMKVIIKIDKNVQKTHGIQKIFWVSKKYNENNDKRKTINYLIVINIYTVNCYVYQTICVVLQSTDCHTKHHGSIQNRLLFFLRVFNESFRVLAHVRIVSTSRRFSIILRSLHILYYDSLSTV